MTNELTFCEQLKEALKIENFGLDKDGDGYPTIQYVIADFMLRDFNAYDKHRLLDTYAGKVKNSLYKAISQLHDEGIEVYIIKPLGQRNITYITTNSANALAVKEDEKRIRNNTAQAIKRGLNSLEKHPETFNRVLHSCDEARRKLLNDKEIKQLMSVSE